MFVCTQHSEEFSAEDATTVFFSVTKLFQNQDVHLRRMIYLVLKELVVGENERFIVISCLSKDMNSTKAMFRANSIRVLARITDHTTVGTIERFLKQAIVDSNPFIVSSTLIASQHMFNNSPDVVKRWTNEVQEALTAPERGKSPYGSSKMVRYQALALLYKIKQHDRLAMSKIVSTLAAKGARGPMLNCLKIRIVTSLLKVKPSNELLQILTDALHDKNFMVMYEAARSICSLPNLTPVQVAPAVSVLQEFLTSPIPTQRFAAVRTLSKVVSRFPLMVTPCSADLENLITDNNRSVATLAITTLLKTGVESNVDRLMKSISGFMNDIADDFKIVLVDAIKTLCLKFPHKYRSLLNFLATSLREEGGFKYKEAIVNAMLAIMNEVSDACEVGLEHFCEFIEDCEFPELSIAILDVLAEKGPNTKHPAKYIRFIFNRIILETASVRSASVTALARFGNSVPYLTEDVIVLLNRCVHDNDDDVRDRAVFYRSLLKESLVSGSAVANSKFMADAGGSSKGNFRIDEIHGLFDKSLSEQIKLADLEASLEKYVGNQAHSVDDEGSDDDAAKKNPFSEPHNFTTMFNIKDHLVEAEVEEGSAGAADEKSGSAMVTDSGDGGLMSAAHGGVTGYINPYETDLYAIPEIKALGNVFTSSEPVELTESETEYVVSGIKHIFPEHIVFQFNIRNNMDDQLLENVSVEMEPSEVEWPVVMTVPEPTIKFSETGTSYVVLKREVDEDDEDDLGFNSGLINCTLKFYYTEVDSNGESFGVGVEDEYQLEEIEVKESDFMKLGQNIGLPEFKRQWDSFGDANEVVKKYSLGLDSLQSAVEAVIDLLGMQPCENSGNVADGAQSCGVMLSGIFFGNMNVLVRAGFVLDARQSVTLRVFVRSDNGDINNMIAQAIR